MRSRALLVWVCISLVLSGCLVGPDYRRPCVELPPSWRPIEGSMPCEPAALAGWWHAFNDPVLNSLMDEALGSNLALREAALRIAEARYQRCITRGDLFPQFDAEGSYTFQKTPTTGGLTGQIIGGGGFNFDSTTDQYAMGLNGAWEVDIFGRLRRNLQAATADVNATGWAYRDTMVLLLAEVATNYVDARTFQKRLEIARQNLDSQLRSLQITEQKFEARLINELDVAEARANASTTESDIPALNTAYQQAVNRLSVLLGRPPGYVDDRLTTVSPIPNPPEYLAVGFPADLLRQRPDVRQAEYNLIGQVARIGVAKADLYPQLSLSGAFGVNSQRVDQLFTTEGISANVGPTLRWNILNFGRVRCNIRLQDALAGEYLAAYRRTVLEAAEEVDNALVSYSQEQDRQGSLEEAVTAWGRAVELSRLQYQQGTVDFQRVLVSQRSLLQVENQLAESRGNVTRSFIELYRALGGGWQQMVVLSQPLAEELVSLPETTEPEEPSDEGPVLQQNAGELLVEPAP